MKNKALPKTEITQKNKIGATGVSLEIIKSKGSAFALSLLFLFCATAQATELTASYYSKQSLKKEGTWKYGEKKMANGDRFDENSLTCATRLYPLGSFLVVVNRSTGKKSPLKSQIGLASVLLKHESTSRKRRLKK